MQQGDSFLIVGKSAEISMVEMKEVFDFRKQPIKGKIA